MKTTELPELLEADVREWVGETSMKRGRPYFRNGAVQDTRRQGTVLKARCQGSTDQPYRLEITLGPEGIESADCSCPVGYQGRCKHAAAVLLTWLDDPEAFVEVEDIEVVLKKRSKAELIGLVREILDRYPDLETLIDLPSPSGKGRAKATDPNAIRRQVKNAFDNAGYEWGAATRAARELSRLQEVL
jgi:uncharacterized Zn finger protein